MTVSEVAAYLRAHDKYLILTHRRPDGDTLGCAAALCAMLRQMGKTAGILYMGKSMFLLSLKKKTNMKCQGKI